MAGFSTGMADNGGEWGVRFGTATFSGMVGQALSPASDTSCTRELTGPIIHLRILVSY